MSFVIVRDEHGNHQSVARSSVKTKRRYETEQAELDAPAGPRLGYTEYHRGLQSQAEVVHEQYFGSGRRPLSPDAMRWTPEEGEQEMQEWQSIFRDRRRPRGDTD